MSGGNDHLDPTSLGAGDGGVALIMTGVTGGVLNTVTPVVDEGYFPGWPPFFPGGEVYQTGRAIGSIIVPDASKAISFSRTAVIQTGQDETVMYDDGRPNTTQNTFYSSHLIVHVGNESVDVGLLYGYSSHFESGPDPQPDHPLTDLTLDGTLDELTVVLAGQTKSISDFDLTAATHVSGS